MPSFLAYLIHPTTALEPALSSTKGDCPMVAYHRDPALIAAMIDGHRQLAEFVAEGPRPDPFEGIDWGQIRAEQAAAACCPSCGAGGPTLGTDLPCNCAPPAEYTVRTVQTEAGVILYLDGARYNAGNGRPFYFASVAGALRTAADEAAIRDEPALGGDDEADDVPF